MKKLFWAIVVAALAVLLLLFGAKGLNYMQGRNEVKAEKTLREMAEELNRSLPMMMDSETRLDKCDALLGKVFRYNYTVVSLNDSIIAATPVDVAALRGEMASRMQNQLRGTPDMDVFRKMGAAVSYNYNDNDGKFLFSIDFANGEY